LSRTAARGAQSAPALVQRAHKLDESALHRPASFASSSSSDGISASAVTPGGNHAFGMAPAGRITSSRSLWRTRFNTLAVATGSGEMP